MMQNFEKTISEDFYCLYVNQSVHLFLNTKSDDFDHSKFAIN